MNVEKYLSDVLRSQTIYQDSDEARALNNELHNVGELIRCGLPDVNPNIVPGGSLAKGTIIRAAFDLDVICYFDHDDSGAGDTLAEIRRSVYDTLSTVYEVEPKRSALRLTRRTSGERMPFMVDVVPGRYVDESRKDVFLYQEGAEKERLKTNLNIHIQHIQESGQTAIIKLAKLWKLRADLEIKTFVLELIVIKVLEGNSSKGLADHMVAFWTAVRDDIDDLTIEDPANPTGNDLSPLFGDEEREALSSAATVALDLADAGDWNVLFGPPENDKGALDRAVISPSALFTLGDTSHALAPPWPVRRTQYRVDLTCTAYRRNNRTFLFTSNRSIATEGMWLRFEARTNAPRPYEIRWQVVNTGRHAEEVGGLRGREFFESRSRKGETVGGPIHWERTEYTGKHWIECFIVKDEQIWARSGPFYVKIINRSRKGTSWFRGRRRSGRRG